MNVNKTVNEVDESVNIINKTVKVLNKTVNVVRKTLNVVREGFQKKNGGKCDHFPSLPPPPLCDPS